MSNRGTEQRIIEAHEGGLLPSTVARITEVSHMVCQQALHNADPVTYGRPSANALTPTTEQNASARAPFDSGNLSDFTVMAAAAEHAGEVIFQPVFFDR